MFLNQGLDNDELITQAKCRTIDFYFNRNPVQLIDLPQELLQPSDAEVATWIHSPTLLPFNDLVVKVTSDKLHNVLSHMKNHISKRKYIYASVKVQQLQLGQSPGPFLGWHLDGLIRVIKSRTDQESYLDFYSRDQMLASSPAFITYTSSNVSMTEFQIDPWLTKIPWLVSEIEIKRNNYLGSIYDFSKMKTLRHEPTFMVAFDGFNLHRVRLAERSGLRAFVKLMATDVPYLSGKKGY